MAEHIHQELIHLGAIFRSKREEKSLSLKDVETATAIRFSCLEAIENGCLGKLISPIYAQGFIKKYAAYLGLDSDRLLQEHPYVIKIFKEFSEHNMEMLLDLESMGGRNSPEKILRSWLHFWWIGLILGGSAVIWWIGSRLSIF